MAYMFGQSMDNAAAMSGSQSGVQKFISDDVPTAICVHCVSNSLNLCLEKLVKYQKYSHVLQPYSK